MKLRLNAKKIEADYCQRYPDSQKLYSDAVNLFPSGVTHDGRFLRPFPVYVNSAQGPYKHTIEGHRLIDYWMGHGALLLGHRHPQVMISVQEQLERGTHYGACHPLEVQWGTLVTEIISCAEKIRFTSSGTEATQMLLRLARASSGKDLIIKFAGHFHGWHTELAGGLGPDVDAPPQGVPQSLDQSTLVMPANDLNLLEDSFKSNHNIAGVILEPNGGSYGRIPLQPGFLRGLRDLTKRFGVLLLFDEVVTGFRLAPGGAAEYYGVEPDCAALAKILCGGLPGGAVVGPAEMLDYLAFNDKPGWNTHRKIKHLGTYNANPLSASAGIKCLELVKDGQASRKANENGKMLRQALNGVLQKHDIEACFYGEGSFIHYLIHDGCVESRKCDLERCLMTPEFILKRKSSPESMNLRLAFLSSGIDMPPAGGWLSIYHDEVVINATAQALDRIISDYLVIC